MTVLGPGQTPSIRPHYPHFLAEDNGVWTRFLETDANRISRLWYDVRVGKPMYLPDDASEVEKKVAAGVSRKRIDVVCLVDSDFWVVEVKPLASMLAVGQVISYARLFAKEYLRSGRVMPVIVCDNKDEDLLDGFGELGILVLTNE